MPVFPMLQEREKLWLKIGAAIIGIGGISISLYQICKWFIGKKRPAIQRQIEEQQEEEEKDTTTFGKAERRKAQGIDAYKQKRYNEAIQIFNDAAKILDGGDEQIDEEAKSRELRASCQNNIAACHDALKNLEACIEHCTAAIALNPDYVKALTRRAKCYQKLGRIAEAIDDYMDLLTLENENAIQPAHLNQIHHEMDKMIDALIEPQMAEIIQSRVGQAQKISQSIVAPWYFFKLAQNDPLLARAQAIDTKTAKIEMAKGLDRALIALAQQKYDDIARLAIDFIEIELEDCENFAWDNPLERAQAVLLAARFLHYQSLDDAAHSMAERFTPFWDRLDEAQKLANKDLHVAQIVLQMQMLGFGENGGNAIDSSSPSHRLTPTNKQRILQLAEDALRINPKNVDPLLLLGFILICAEQPDEAVNTFQRAKKLDKEHPYVKYYEKCANLLNALQQQDLSRLRHCFYELERALKEANSQHPPPGYVLLKMIEASGQLGLHEVAIEFVRMAVQQMPNNPDVIVYASMMNPDQQMEKEFEKATKVDPNYWRTHRLLAMLRLKKSEYDEAEREYEFALEVARSKVELNLLLKEREMMRLTKSRNQRGKRIPQHRQLAE